MMIVRSIHNLSILCIVFQGIGRGNEFVFALRKTNENTLTEIKAVCKLCKFELFATQNRFLTIVPQTSTRPGYVKENTPMVGKLKNMCSGKAKTREK